MLANHGERVLAALRAVHGHRVGVGQFVQFDEAVVDVLVVLDAQGERGLVEVDGGDDAWVSLKAPFAPLSSLLRTWHTLSPTRKTRPPELASGTSAEAGVTPSCNAVQRRGAGRPA